MRGGNAGLTHQHASTGFPLLVRRPSRRQVLRPVRDLGYQNTCSGSSVNLQDQEQQCVAPCVCALRIGKAPRATRAAFLAAKEASLTGAGCLLDADDVAYIKRVAASRRQLKDRDRTEAGTGDSPRLEVSVNP